MKIALLSDIHGNDIAFAAAERHAKANGADQFVVAGDLITDNPMTKAVLDRAKALTQHIVYGNREQYLVSYHEQKADHWNDSIQFAPLRRTYEQLSDQDLQFLQSLPESLEIPLDRSNRLFVIHQAPASVYAGQTRDCYLHAVSRYFQKWSGQYSVCCTGHTHIAGTIKTGGQLYINAGSVGQHFYGRFQAVYAMLDWNQGSASVEIHHVPYDGQAYWSMLEASGLFDDRSTRHWTQLMYRSIQDEHNYFSDFFAAAEKIRRGKHLQDPHVSDEVWLETVRLFINKGILT